MVTAVKGESRLLSPDQARARARKVKLLLTDCDGVLTDAGVYYSEMGETLRRFSVRDGMGVERLREVGIATGILSRERSRTVERRAEKLGLPYLFLGVRDKASHLWEIERETGLPLDTYAYIGDDVNDLTILTLVAAQGLTAAPADAMPEVLEGVQYRCGAPGGYGAFRDFAEWILDLRRGP